MTDILKIFMTDFLTYSKKYFLTDFLIDFLTDFLTDFYDRFSIDFQKDFLGRCFDSFGRGKFYEVLSYKKWTLTTDKLFENRPGC